MLGEGTQVGVVAEVHAQLGRYLGGDHPGERAMAPAQVRCEVDPAVGPAHSARNAHADADRPGARRELLAQWAELLGDLDRDLVGGVVLVVKR